MKAECLTRPRFLQLFYLFSQLFIGALGLCDIVTLSKNACDCAVDVENRMVKQVDVFLRQRATWLLLYRNFEAAADEWPARFKQLDDCVAGTPFPAKAKTEPPSD